MSLTTTFIDREISAT